LSVDYDYRAEAQAAMRWAVAATCERERLEWVRIALAWHDLAPTCATLLSMGDAPDVAPTRVYDDVDTVPINLAAASKLGFIKL
jgi:hypothetical protein